MRAIKLPIIGSNHRFFLKLFIKNYTSRYAINNSLEKVNLNFFKTTIFVKKNENVYFYTRFLCFLITFFKYFTLLIYNLIFISWITIIRITIFKNWIKKQELKKKKSLKYSWIDQWFREIRVVVQEDQEYHQLKRN